MTIVRPFPIINLIGVSTNKLNASNTFDNCSLKPVDFHPYLKVVQGYQFNIQHRKSKRLNIKKLRNLSPCTLASYICSPKEYTTPTVATVIICWLHSLSTVSY